MGSMKAEKAVAAAGPSVKAAGTTVFKARLTVTRQPWIAHIQNACT